MAYYNNGSWSPAAPRQSWEQQHSAPSSRAGATPTSAVEEPEAFYYQIATVERAVETWRKASKGPLDPRIAPISRHTPTSDFDPMRPHSAGNLQNFYQSQRYGPRSEGDQAKRRMAAQRERELRNYHQEQQFQKRADLTTAKSDRSMSPSVPNNNSAPPPNVPGMSEEDRRELIARQHRALYGNESSLYPGGETPTSRPISQDARVSGPLSGGGFRGNSPLAFDPFGSQSLSGGQSSEGPVTMPPREGKDSSSTGQDARANNTASPSSNTNTSYSLFDNPQQSSRTSNSSPSGSPPGTKPSGQSGSNVAPIGTRPAQSAAPQQPGLQKRSTTPLPSPLSYSYSAEQQQQQQGDKPAEDKNNSGGNIKGGWGNGVWGGKGGLGVQAKVWG